MTYVFNKGLKPVFPSMARTNPSMQTDNGKPAARLGRKAMGLFELARPPKFAASQEVAMFGRSLQSVVPRLALQIVRPRRGAQDRRGTVVIMAVLVVVLLLAMVALAVDSGYLLLVRTELQRSADAAAMGATWELLDQRMRNEPNQTRLNNAAAQYAGLNKVAGQRPQLDLGATNSLAGDVVYGRKPDPMDRNSPLSIVPLNQANAVKVRVVRSSQLNGEAPLFFARIWGKDSSAVEATGESAFLMNFRGFRIPDTEPRTVPLLPFTLHENSWKAVEDGVGPDQLTWDGDQKTVRNGADGEPEINFFPLDNDAPGNWGIVDIGGGNGTPPLRRQILEGANQTDLDHHGGQLALDSGGQLQLGGKPGLRAGAISSELTAIIGQPRIMPIYRTVSGQGNNSSYTIVGFAGMRIMAVNLTGNNKYVKLQGAPMVIRGGIPAQPGEQTSDMIFSPVMLTN